MATKEQIEKYIMRFEENMPRKVVNKMSETQCGSGAVLRYLCEAGGCASAGEISSYLCVSTARTAALFKKMEAKDLITRESDPNDKRVTVVKLSKHGEDTIKAIRERLYTDVGKIIDVVGEEKLDIFTDVFMTIRDITTGPPSDLL